MSPRFLSLAEVLEFHEDLLRSFGGESGIRDLALLESAVAMSKSGSGKKYFHEFPFGMAAAYAYHIAQNHPFIDGNKRTALAAALVFLEINRHPILGGEDALEAATRKIASGKMDKDGFAGILEKTYKRFKSRA
ncbi:MAG: type II toxin-antitoxin system death-on-curing family toxin [Elusimicrobiota bacterium]|jgi:death-on-curing protein